MPLAVLLVATMALDILWAAFTLAGLDSFGFSPWSHSLLMAGAWSLVAGLVTALVTRAARPAVVIGLLVFSHWAVDFLSHPMVGVTEPLLPDLPLGFSATPKLGLGLYATTAGMIAGEAALLITGITLYALHRKRSLR